MLFVIGRLMMFGFREIKFKGISPHGFAELMRVTFCVLRQKVTKNRANTASRSAF